MMIHYYVEVKMLKYHLIYKEALSFIIVLLKNGMNKMRTVVEFISLEQ